jgi:hypothetical protein
MRAPKARGGGSPSLATAQLVACVDGPLRGQWFHLADWRARIDGARHMVNLGQRAGASLAYSTPSRGDMVSHPHFDGVAGMAVRCDQTMRGQTA